jgi:choline dehydrogenase-like flavoprotein
MEMRKHEIIIVGSGAGGATLARDLSRKGRDVLIVEAGEDKFPLPLTIAKSQENIGIFEVFGAGGATVLCNGNGVRALERDLASMGVELDDEYRELEAELPIAPIAESLLTERGSLRLLEILRPSEYRLERMPKFIDPAKCVGCGMCSVGCPHGAKWDARVFLRDAVSHGADVVYNTRVEQVRIENGRAVGVQAMGPTGMVRLDADFVVLAAGGLRTPVILKKSGFDNAGRKLFVDLCEIWSGVTPEIDISGEPPMQLVYLNLAQSRRISLCTVLSKDKERLRFYTGNKADLYLNNNWMGILVKIGDTNDGGVSADGTISKSVTPEDRKKLDEGGAVAREILRLAGAKDDSIVKFSQPYGGHNGATAAIGDVVDTDLRTEVRNLFVCDASVLPVAPGLPPVLTIMALAKRLAKTLA